jgi:hypothetical protein
MATSPPGLSASVTRILSLTGFPKELKTKDIQSAFTDWESSNGGFKIKWRDDTSLLIVFQDPSVAKRAYLCTIANPPPILISSSGIVAVLRPYDGSDAQAVIQNVNSRGQGQHNSSTSRHNVRAASISTFPNTPHGRGQSLANNRNGRTENGQNGQMTSSITIPENQYANGLPPHPTNTGREPSPTLPNLPSHPTLNALISSSLGEEVTHDAPPVDPAIVATSLHPDGLPQGGPRIGDSGKRMLGAALGMRHPGLPPRMVNGGAGGTDQTMRDVQRAMGGLVVAE